MRKNIKVIKVTIFNEIIITNLIYVNCHSIIIRITESITVFIYFGRHDP